MPAPLDAARLFRPVGLALLGHVPEHSDTWRTLSSTLVALEPTAILAAQHLTLSIAVSSSPLDHQLVVVPALTFPSVVFYLSHQSLKLLIAPPAGEQL